MIRSVKKDFNGERAKIKHAWESDHSFATLEEMDSRTIYRFQNAAHLYQFEVIVPGFTFPARRTSPWIGRATRSCYRLRAPCAG